MTDYSNFEVEDFLHDDFFIDWVLKKEPDHDAFWAKWLEQHPEQQKTIGEAMAIAGSFRIKPLKVSLSDEKVNAMIAGLQQRISVPEKKKTAIYRTMWVRIAAAICVFATVGAWFYLSNYKKINQGPAVEIVNMLNVSNQSHVAKLIRMSDGSLAVIKPGSSLRYPATFSGTRDVVLTGEAFFEVHKNPHKPFLVHNGNIIVKVLGTSFTVKSIAGKQDVKVVVNTGRVSVYDGAADEKDPDRSKEVILTQNQQVVFSAGKQNNEKQLLPRPLILSQVRAPKEFTFDNTPVISVIEKINKAYGVNIEYDREKLEKLTLTTSISEKPLDEKVRIICKALNMECSFKDGRIIIGSPDNKLSSGR